MDPTNATAPMQQISEKSVVGGSCDLSPAQNDRVAFFESCEELQELCRDNGLSATQFARKGTSVTALDMFLGFWSSMKPVMHFPALRELSIVKHPTITVMEGIEHCPNLEVLCITECGIERMTSLENCRNLRKLNLSSNKIRSIEQLENLERLEILWLNDNQLEKLDGLWKLTQLKQLWACRNRIERIESALSCCVRLTELNLADNRLCNFKSLLSLTNLDQLTVLTLSDPHYGDNPVCKLCNYQTYLMCHLSRLTCLDTVELSTRTKQIAEATMIKKKMYYNMRIKAIKRDIRAQIKHSENIRNQADQHIETSLEALVREKKEIERYIADLAEKDAKEAHADCQATQGLKKKLECVDACLKSKYSTIYRMNYDLDRLCTKLQWTSDINISRLLLELETGGNIRLEDGTPSDAWCVSCVDLVRSRLFPTELRPFGIQDIRINRVTRINNRYLRHRFHTRMEEIMTVPEQQMKDNVSKKGVTVPVKEPEDQPSERDREKQFLDKQQQPAEQQTDQASVYPGSTLENSLEYLFYVQPPLFDQQRRNHEIEQFFAAENGFRDPSEYGSMGVEGAIKLSNSVALLDKSRLAAALTAKGRLLQKQQVSAQDLYRAASLPIQHEKDVTNEMRGALELAVSGEWELPSGVLLVVKVFPGYTKCTPEEGKASTSSSVLPRRVDARDYVGLQSLQVQRNLVNSEGEHSTTRQKLYYLFDKALVLPEYLVEYQYVLSDRSSGQTSSTGSTFGALTNDLRPQSSSADGMDTPRKMQANGAAEATDLGIATKLVEDFERKYRTRRSPSTSSDGSSLGDDDIMRVLRMEPILPTPRSVDNILVASTRLNSAEVNRVKHLNLLGCGLESIPDLLCLKDHLEVLVLSYNNIQSINHHLDGLRKLRTLDLSFNRVGRLAHLDRCESLQTLEANNNQLNLFEDLEYLGRVFRGRDLKQLDLRKNAICGTKRYRLHVLQHLPTLDCLDRQSVTKDESLCAQQLITKLSSAKIWDYFYRMKVISVPPSSANSDSSSERSARGSNNKPEYDEEDHRDTGRPSSPCLSAFRPCWNAIEELIFNRELIGEIEGFEHAANLRVASFSDNVIKRIGGLENCARLEELSLEDNEIAKVENLESLVCLKKLHLGRNRISAIERLDMLENLTQLSLEENQITSLRGLGSALKLMELYIGNNRIEVLKEIQHLKSLPKLTILDLSGNELTRTQDYRLYAVYYLRRVKVLDGLSISPQDQSDAKQKYSGKLTMEFILEKCAGAGGNGPTNSTGNVNSPTDRIQEMDLSSCRIREIGSIPGKIFTNVRELNLENNQISDICGLETLPKLRILNLNRNRVDKLLPTSSSSTYTAPEELEGRGILACLNVEQLYLAYNQINDMTMLGLQFLDRLKVLHLQGNSIVFFAGLDSNTELRELCLDKNRIRQLDPSSAVALRQLRVLTMDDNGMKSLANFNNLLNLETLDLSNNRLIDLEEIEKLTAIPTMVDLRLTNNPLTKKHLYRQTTLYKLSSVRSLDGREVSADERERVSILFVHERAAVAAGSTSGYNSNNPNDRYIEARSYGSQITPAPSTIPSSNNNHTNAAMASLSTRATIPPLSTGEVLAGSLLRKHSGPATVAYNQNQFPPQPVHAFPKPEQLTGTGIVIAPSIATTKSLLAHTQAASYRNPHSLTNQSGFILGSSGSGASPSAPSSSTVTVASAFHVAMANGSVADQFHLGGLRSERRRVSSVHYDQSFSGASLFTAKDAPHSCFDSQNTNCLQLAPRMIAKQAEVPPLTTGSQNGGALSGELKLPVGIVSSHAVIRGPTSLSGQAVSIHPSSGDSTSVPAHKTTPSSLGTKQQQRVDSGGGVASSGRNRAFSGSTAPAVNQKRYQGYQDFYPESTIPYLSAKLNQNQQARPR